MRWFLSSLALTGIVNLAIWVANAGEPDSYTTAGGDKYVGEVVSAGEDNVVPNGHGTYSWTDGTEYVGEFKDGKRHGQGTYTTADGFKYVGEYKDDLPNGQGTETYADGDKYVGELKDGL